MLTSPKIKPGEADKFVGEEEEIGMKIQFSKKRKKFRDERTLFPASVHLNPQRPFMELVGSN